AAEGATAIEPAAPVASTDRAPDAPGAPAAAASGSGTALAGRLLWHPSLSPRDFRVGYRRAGGDDAVARPLPLAADGRFWLRRAPPGTIDVVVSLQGERQPLQTVTGVVVPAANDGRDPRVNPLDVQRARRLRFKVLDHHGEPLAQPVQCVPVIPGAETGTVRTLSDAKGELELLVFAPDCRVTLWADGFVPFRGSVRDGDEIALQRAAVVRVRIRVEEGVKLPGFLSVDLVPMTNGFPHKVRYLAPVAGAEVSGAPGHGVTPFRRHTKTPPGIVRRRFAVTQPGVYRVRWSATEGGRVGAAGSLHSYGPRAVIGSMGTIDDIDFVLTAERVEKARQRLREKARAIPPKRPVAGNPNPAASGEGQPPDRKVPR
ncbi:MAG: hypothetical protein AAF628_09380, partial [Planctomycetota bacterium]